MSWLSSVASSVGDAFKNSAGSLVSSIGSYFTNKENRENQDYWNERQIDLADSAHQRAVLDLAAAGLNPILAANSAASTPSLTSARLENPVSSFAQNSRELAKALTGQTKAEVKQAKADAVTSKAYADKASDLAAAELETARAEAEKARNFSASSLYQGTADMIDEAARVEALTGSHMSDIDGLLGSKRDREFENLVQQYRNEIKSGKYKASVGRAVFQDFLSGSSSASQMYRDLKGRKAGKVKP